MPSSDDDIIRNGTLKQWLTYVVVFGGTKTGEYATTGGTRIKGWWIVGALVLLAGLGWLR